MAFKDKLRNFDKKRRQIMCGIEPLLYKLICNNSKLERDLLSNDAVKKILIVRNNKRIGNMFFLLPFIHEVKKQYPNATIDLMLNQPWQGRLFSNMGIKKMYFSHFSFSHFFSCIKTMRELNQAHYDLLFSPKDSAGDSILSALVPSKNKVSIYNPRRHQVYPHSPSPVEHTFKHAALVPLSILKGLGCEVDGDFNHSMMLSSEETEFGEKEFIKLKEDGKVNIAYFRGARGNKKLTDEAWCNIFKKIELQSDKPINWIEILSPDITTPLVAKNKAFKHNNMRYLASFLQNVDLFVCCDTGPLHLADSVNTKCYGLYNRTNSEVFGLLGKSSLNIHNTDGNYEEFNFPKLT